ncbi:MAG: phytoene desaturase, partial [Saprospiraceae bacterium]|nr:phytoene desaturase [Saprospiraceae bacterium]
KTEDYIDIIRPELPFNYFFDDGLVLNFYADLERLIEELTTKTEDDKVTIERFLEDIKTKYELTDHVFLQNSLHIISNYWNKEVLKGLVNFHKVEVFRSMDEANKRNFKDEHTRRLFNSFASYMGSSPFKAPGVLNVISHFQLNSGIFLPRGGMYSIAKSLVKLGEELGVSIETRVRVEEIIVENDVTRGVVCNGEARYADIVISNSDVYNTYKKLLPEHKVPAMFLERQKSHSAIVFLWGIKKSFPQLALHNMVLSENMKEEYEIIFKDGDIGEDFTIYLYISSKTNPDDAPEGCENWYVLINAPHLQGQDWEAIKDRVRAKILERLSNILGEDIAQLIAFEKVQDPRTFEVQTGAAFGAIYGNSFNGKLSVFFRHPNFTGKIKNLYFCGGTVHPGSGVPLSLLSAKIVSELIAKQSGKDKNEKRVSRPALSARS